MKSCKNSNQEKSQRTLILIPDSEKEQCFSVSLSNYFPGVRMVNFNQLTFPILEPSLTSMGAIQK